jgi:hypothetical protein
MRKALSKWLKPEGPLTLPIEIGKQLATIEPSICGNIEYYPCVVTLKDGKKIDRVYMVEKETYMLFWGIHPLDDPGKNYIPVSEIASVAESPTRLPAQFANKLYVSPEASMGYEIFTIVFSDGSRKAYLTGNAVDFVDYPQGHGPNDVVDVLPNVGRESKPLRGPKYYWCLYTHSGASTTELLPNKLRST